MYVVDTNIVIWILRSETQYLEWFKKEAERTTLGISTITIAEIYKNLFPSELINTEDWLDKFQKLMVTEKIAKQAGFYWQQYLKKNIHLLDCLIAATAKVNSAQLVTLNLKHFPMTDVQVIKPL